MCTYYDDIIWTIWFLSLHSRNQRRLRPSIQILTRWMRKFWNGNVLICTVFQNQLLHWFKKPSRWIHSVLWSIVSIVEWSKCLHCGFHGFLWDEWEKGLHHIPCIELSWKWRLMLCRALAEILEGCYVHEWNAFRLHLFQLHWWNPSLLVLSIYDETLFI